jgi:uncharacterized radical SAM superfamily Fe-S cluster-containing enzyme
LNGWSNCAARGGIKRITISTHGLRFLNAEWLLEKLAKLEARIVLSFDSFTPGSNVEMLGSNFFQAKMRVNAYHLSNEAFTRMIDTQVRNEGQVESIALAGGEPSMCATARLDGWGPWKKWPRPRRSLYRTRTAT